MEYTTDLIPRILRDINNGVLALDQRGRIIYINTPCEAMLGKHEDLIGKSYAEAFFDDPHEKENDTFHQFVLDAIYQKEQTHKGTVAFFDSTGKKRFIRITSSFLKSESGEENVGIVLVMVDITETQILKKKRHEASIVFACVLCGLTAYLLILGALPFFNISASVHVLSQIVYAVGCCMTFAGYKLADYSYEDFGLKLVNPMKTLTPAAFISAVGVAFLIILKFVFLNFSTDFFPADTPFWNWNLGLYVWLSYVPACIVQEIIMRSMAYSSIRKIYDGKHGTLVAVTLSALLFSGLHIGHGFFYMVAAGVMMVSLAWLHEKQGNIWGVTLIHYVLGQAADCLGFL